MEEIYTLKAAAGTLAVAEEIVSAIQQVFNKNFSAEACLLSDAAKGEADVYVFFDHRIEELAAYVPECKIIGIEMIPSPQFFISVATLPPNEPRAIFCQSRRSVKTIINYFTDNGLSLENFKIATYEDTPENDLVVILNEAKYIVGVGPLVSAGGVLHTKFGSHLNPTAKIIPINRILSPKSVADLHNWLEDRRQKSIAKLSYDSTHDILTGLHNRRYFEGTCTKYDQKPPLPLAVVVMDLDGLKLINDGYGHTQGDKLLREAAKIIKRSFPPDAVVARLGGDEFAAIMPGTSELELRRVLAKVRSHFKELKKQKLLSGVNISIGYSLATSESRALIEMFNAADKAMYCDKRAHRCRR